MFLVKFDNNWDNILQDEFKKEYYLKIRNFLAREYKNPAYSIYPDMYDIFNALKITDYDDVKAVILGQDPYHGVGQAHGLSFSVKKGIQPPPSLVNIFKEYNDDLGFPIPTSGDLTKWAENGVLLLNTVLTVREGEPNSHKNLGWTTFTDAVIRSLNDREDPVIFLLWGANAKEKLPLITNSRHYVLSAPHPSPLSAHRGFFGCKHFSKCNLILQRQNKAPINWQLSF